MTDTNTHILVNGRFQCHQITGAQRYAAEITTRLADHLEMILPERKLRGMRAHLWEQTVLYKKVGNRLLWSPAISGPLLVKKQIVTIHDISFHDQAECFSRRFAAWYGWLIPRLARRVRHILTGSEFSKMRIVEHCQVDPDKVTVIPYGVDSRFSVPTLENIRAVKEKLALPDRYILFVGSLEPRKNLHRLLSAWEKIACKQSEVGLVLVGASSNVFSSAGLSSLPPRVKLAGYVTDRDLPAVYAGALCFVFPSLYEGFGFPVLEAMACGTPVICSKTTSIPEVAGNAAVYIQPHDIDSIAQSINDLIEDEKLQSRLREQGLGQAQKFDWNVTAQLTRDVLQRIADNN